ncbi:hypothetical protein DFJ73DRAFT_779968 [Zopfochytrium polystomum]|nr:hypothetical protein DFJ73DRAFT_779968 [Zopfochytrium polystomum]
MCGGGPWKREKPFLPVSKDHGRQSSPRSAPIAGRRRPKPSVSATILTLLFVVMVCRLHAASANIPNANEAHVDESLAEQILSSDTASNAEADGTLKIPNRHVTP